MSRNNLVRRTFETLLMLNAYTIRDSNTLFNLGFYHTIKIKERKEFSKALKDVWHRYILFFINSEYHQKYELYGVSEKDKSAN